MKTKISKTINTLMILQNKIVDILLTLCIFLPVYAIPILLVSIKYKKEEITDLTGALIIMWIFFCGRILTDLYIEKPLTLGLIRKLEDPPSKDEE